MFPISFLINTKNSSNKAISTNIPTEAFYVFILVLLQKIEHKVLTNEQEAGKRYLVMYLMQYIVLLLKRNNQV